MKIAAALVAVVLAAGTCSATHAEDQNQQPTDDAKKKADDAKKKADDAKKKADDAKKKAEEANKKAEEAQKKQDDPKNWPARDFASAAAVPGAVCVYIKDPKPKKNHEAEALEGKEMLGNEEVRVKLRPFNRIKIKSDGSDGKGWPSEWLAHAKNGAVLVLFNSDPHSDPGKNAFIGMSVVKEKLLEMIDTVLKYEAELKAAREARAKEEAAKNPPPETKPEVPGLDMKKPDKDKNKKKPGSKEPQDE
ncbi:MAG: alanine-zipper protein [Planctomycetota bacterium]